MLPRLLESVMRLVSLMVAVALATPASAQDARTPPNKSGSDVQSPVTTPKPAPKVSSGEAENKAGEDMAAQQQRADEAKQKAWDSRMKQIMSGICKGC